MPAYSVTGRGPGLSNGLPKPENNCGCGFCGNNTEENAEPAAVSGCRKTLTVGKNTVQSTSTSGKTEKTCS